LPNRGETLARYATDLRYEDLPEDVIRIAKRAILDTFGCAFGGFTAGPSKLAIKLANERQCKAGCDCLVQRHQDEPPIWQFSPIVARCQKRP
jgi:2-methylcitrate dehydratase